MLKVFLSYTKADQAQVHPYYAKLQASGFEPWMDVERLVPGQNWSWEIDQALADSNVVMLFLSQASVNKRGFVQREANQAMENLKPKLLSDIYIIPILLEQCEVPAHISDRLQFVYHFENGSWEKVLKSLELAKIEQQIISETGAPHGPFRVFEESISEDWEGMPGHNIQISYPRFTSATLPDAAIALSNIFAGRAYNTLLKSRSRPWHQMNEDSCFGTNNGRWDHYSISYADEHFVSLSYTVGLYGAGAAHPNTNFECHNFAIVGSKIFPLEIVELFDDWQAAKNIIIKACIQDIQREYWERMGDFPDSEAMKWINAGVNSHPEDNCVITEKGLTVLFSPYEVGPYAAGSFSANVPSQSLERSIELGFRNLLFGKAVII
ncbi:TIR domain-containing protein [Pseudomonas viridiflava]|uniref:TIR domain-containing protein n=1 Tax=Pseudomonas viridiflava TaxID=33069 RepID=UPI000F039EFF|nr:TIR domain-containing protein [Pseudomonas viridiflava]